jgi:hypothetical protein
LQGYSGDVKSVSQFRIYWQNTTFSNAESTVFHLNFDAQSAIQGNVDIDYCGCLKAGEIFVVYACLQNCERLSIVG